VIPYVKNTLLTAASVVASAAMDEVVSRILLGDTAVLIDGEATALIVATRDVRMRAIGEPQTENEVFGPREAFNEDLRTNITLVRRRVKNANLVVADHVVGRRSNTEVEVLYLKGIADFRLIGEVERRLGNIDIDSPHYSGIQRQIEDHPHSPFPTVMSTERPDRFAAALLKGKVGILIDGTPFGLLAPAVISDFFAAGDDYYEKWPTATVLRLLRYVAAFLAVSVPALYVAVTAFHPAMIPTPLALTIGTSREGVPFPAFIEAVIMILFLEVMQEAGVRMPKNIGQAVSIVGGLVIGDASVRAGLISSSLVIVTAFTAIATFSIANYRMALAIRVLRIPLMVAGASFGMFGVMIVLLIIVVHVNIIESFGEPYLASLVPRRLADLQDAADAVIVAPAESRDERPAYLEPEDSRRHKP
ncbi:MAG TPA: spore germination protein, partial [Negativicutes bacterium]|nr:spore germination protein [Negativicutes bacterium]